jgi:DNA-binding NarL/FixJ family response regulator
MRVLLLDDDAFMLKLLADMVDDHGQHEVVSEKDGRRALLELRQRPPDLVICDLSMPAMDGIDFLRLAAAQQFRGAMILLSGIDGVVLKTAGRLAAAQGLYILAACAKPIDADTMAELMTRAETRRQALIARDATPSDGRDGQDRQ